MGMSFAPRVALNGFDRSADPPWQMVPVEGQRVLTISGHGNLFMRVNSPNLKVEVTKSGRNTVLTLTGGESPTWATVEWVSDLSPLPGPYRLRRRAEPGFSLAVSVKAPRIINTAFHYVDDGRRQKTNRRIADLDRLIEGANRILTPQANVILKRKSAAPLAVAHDLGRVVRSVPSALRGAPHNVPAAEHEWDILKALGDAAADFNVFFVREYEQDTTPNRDDAEAAAESPGKMCIFEDNIVRPPGEVLAHETVHALGVYDHSTNRYHLISSGATRLGRFINRVQANIINPSGT